MVRDARVDAVLRVALDGRRRVDRVRLAAVDVDSRSIRDAVRRRAQQRALYLKLDSRLGAVVRERGGGFLVLGGLLPVGDREKRLGLVVAADDELGAEELLRGARVVWWRAVAGRGRGALDSSTLTCFFAVWLSAAPIVSSGL